MKKASSLPEWLYRLLLLAYPADFRRAAGPEVAGVFGELHRDEWRAGGVRAVLALWRRSIWQVLSHGLQERLARPRLTGPSPAPTSGGPMLPRVAADMRYAIRSLRRTPVFTATAVGIATLGIGATTTIFSIVDNVLLRPLPYERPEELYTFTKGGGSLPVPDFLDVRDRTSSFARVSAMFSTGKTLTGDGAPQQVQTSAVTDGFLATFGVRAAMGRLFVAEDFGRSDVAVLSHGLWQRRWGGAPDVVGRTINIDGEPLEVVGVAAPFAFPEGLGAREAEMWLPFDAGQPQFQNRRMYILAAAARLAPGVTAAAAQAELDALAEALAEEHPIGNLSAAGAPLYFPLVSLHEATVGTVAQPLYIFLGAVGLLLLIACTNIANLFLARGTERHREMALRAALGAERMHLVRQSLTESITLALGGGVLGLGLAAAGIRLFTAYSPSNIPRLDSVAIDWRIGLFAVVISGATGILFGLIPALRAAHTDVVDAIKEGAAATTSGRPRVTIRNLLVVVEIGLALMLLVGAGVLFNSFLHLRSVDTGMDPANVSVVSFQLGTFGSANAGRTYGTHDARVRFAREIREAALALPDVTSAGTAVRLPFAGGRCCWRDRYAPRDAPADTLPVWVHPTGVGTLETLGARAVAGRLLAERDGTMRAGADGDAVNGVINRSLAARLWPGRDPIGRELAASGTTVTVVGVIEDIRHFGLDTGDQYDLYIHSANDNPFPLLELTVRSTGDPSALAAGLRTAVWNIDPNLPVNPPQTMEDRIAASITTPRFYSLLVTSFATLAFILAAAGIYGSMLYSVGQRHREMGIRLALGARGRDVARMIMGRGVILTGLGLTLGLTGSLLLSRVLGSLVFGITPRDPATISSVSLLLGAVSLLACYVPARKAARADPTEALRE